ncbi:MAG: Eco57I restriction-modification methylase domain-containing protein [Candidatus Hermodarchaeota archaeon]
MPAQKIINLIEEEIENFENQKLLKKNENRNLGIIYTPNQVVDYMVSNIFRSYFHEFTNFIKIYDLTLDLDDLSCLISRNQEIKINLLKIIKNLKILDPSCGSGRFLLSIAEILFKIYKILSPELSSIDIKKKIIKNNIYAIEIDEAAIIISKLRLIKWYLSNTFNDFKSLRFTEINQIIEKSNLKFNIYNLDFLLEFSSDKFDIIIGNPPYVENKKIKDLDFKKKLIKRYRTAYRLFDLSILFIERSLELLDINGYLSLILPNKFLSADYGIKIRSLLLNESEIQEIINISSLPIFQNAATYPIILSLKKVNTSKIREISIKSFKNMTDLTNNNGIETKKFNQGLINYLPSRVIPLSGNIELLTYLFKNFESFAKTFKDLKIIYRPFGFLGYNRHYDNISDKPQSENDLLLIGTGNIKKYHVIFDKRIKIMGKDLKISYFKYNPNFKHRWSDLDSEKLIFREIAKELTFYYDPGAFTNVTGLYFIKIPSLNTNQLFILLTILNSQFMDSVFKSLFSTLHMAGGYLRCNGSFIKRLPMPKEFPDLLSQLGKILQFLSQLKYDLNSSSFKVAKSIDLVKFKKKYFQELNSYLIFFTKLSDSLVKLLYLDELYLKYNLDYKILRDLLNLNRNFIQIPPKFWMPYFQVKNYRLYSLDELESIVGEIIKFYSQFAGNKELLNQVDKILKPYFR